MTIDPHLRAAAAVSKAWPYEEARKLLKRYPDGKPGGAPILFETGYGPSGLPHLGTFTEVARTLWVRHAFAELSDAPTELVAFSDDMDGMRKVPPGLPEQDMLRENLDKPLCRVPDPWGCHDSFAAHNNAALRRFLDDFGFDYTFVAASDAYAGGRFDDALRSVLTNYDAIMDVMLPTLGAERRATYSPVLPIGQAGTVLQVPLESVDAAAGTVRYRDADGEIVEQSILGGQAKLQWKVDWAMRWAALGVDYEMSGKDLIESVVQSGKIARLLGARPPEGFSYEMFLDEEGRKISKTAGNGLTIDQWLTYGPPESLSFFLYREPKKAKPLSAAIVPRAIDEYAQFLDAYEGQDIDRRIGNPVHHVHAGNPPTGEPLPVGFGLLLNLVGATGATDKALLWSFVQRYAPGTGAETHPRLDALLGYALAYHRDHLAAALVRRAPDAREAAALRDLDAGLADLPADADGDAIQNLVFAVGKRHAFDPLRDWFRTLYETLLGASQGPRMGSFIALYGIAGSRGLIADALSR